MTIFANILIFFKLLLNVTLNVLYVTLISIFNEDEKELIINYYDCTLSCL